MTVDDFLEKLNSTPEKINFSELMDVIEQHYSFTPTAFENGDLHNDMGENSGSCKLFSFAKLNGLSVEQTLACFGTYYREDVLQNPEAEDHQNIRNFMKRGWAGISFDQPALAE
ncbi:MAG: HopJ type III effector protein [Cocleimonas sp.]